MGGYADWLRQRRQLPAATGVPKPSAGTPEPQTQPTFSRSKLSFKERRELDALPSLIESFEAEIAAAHAVMTAADYYRQPGDVLARDQARLHDLEARLATAFNRWNTLEPGAG